MEIEVKVFATLKEHLPKKDGEYSFKVKIEKGETIGNVLSKLKIPEGIPKILLLNGKSADEDSVLQPSDVLSVFPALGGG